MSAKVHEIAMLIALTPPAQRGTAGRAYIDWTLIEDLRTALGEDYTRAAERYRQIIAEEKAEKARTRKTTEKPEGRS